MKLSKKIIYLTGYLLFMFVLIVNLSSCDENNKTEEKSKDKIVEESANEYSKGELIYKQNCLVCHQENGEGMENTFPPLAQSDYLLADKQRAIKQVIQGSSGEITVNGKIYNSTMPPQNLSEEEIAEVLNYVYHSWGNNGELITTDEVKAIKGN